MINNVDKITKLASILSNENAELLQALELYASGDKEKFWMTMDELIKDENTRLYLWDNEKYLGAIGILQEGLIELGFIGSNDWKFSLEEFLYTAKESLDFYGIDKTLWDDIVDKNEIVSPKALQLFAERLPEGFGLGMWDFGDDQYKLIVAPPPSG